LIGYEPDFIINIAASPFSHGQQERRYEILKSNSRKYQLPLLYVNHVGGQNNLIFDGGSMHLDDRGNLINELKYFEEDFRVIDINPSEPAQETISKTKSKYDRIHRALILGISDYFRKMNFKEAVLGLSGGVDSALVLVLAAEALGKERVHPVMMPSAFSSEHSITDSELLCKNLGVNPISIPIEKAFKTITDELNPFFESKPFDVTEENIQSRIRGTMLMALANKHRYVLLNTSNKSELAVGYGTLYGDMAGGLSVIGDLYKTEVYELCRFLNRRENIIPENILSKAPSAELRPDQKDSDSLPDYETLDQILFNHIEERKSTKALLSSGFEKEIVQRVLKLVHSSEYKRFQFAPILRVSQKSFGEGRRIPLVANYNW
jgi:NAD+ synthase (glutamine-hydrolysing)